MLHVHGDRDDRVPYPGRGGAYRTVPDTIATWVSWNDCQPTPVVDRPSPLASLPVTRSTHLGKRPGVDVALFLVHGRGHTWPNDGEDWLTRSMWAFFQAHPKPAP